MSVTSDVSYVDVSDDRDAAEKTRGRQRRRLCRLKLLPALAKLVELVQGTTALVLSQCPDRLDDTSTDWHVETCQVLLGLDRASLSWLLRGATRARQGHHRLQVKRRQGPVG